MTDLDDRHVRRLRLLDIGFELSGADRSVFSILDQLFRAPEFRPDDHVPEVRAEFVRVAESSAGADITDERVVVGASGDPSLDVAEWTFRTFLNRSRGFHLVHAGSLVRSGRGVLLVGPPFAGKTTLTLALCQEGFHYFSDDIGALRRADGRLHPFRRLAGVRVARGARDYVTPDDGAHPPPAPCPLAWVFILGPRLPGGWGEAGAGGSMPEPAPRAVAPSLEGLSLSDATLEVLRHTLNRASQDELRHRYGAHPHLKVFAELLEIVAGARCFRLRAGEPAETARMLRRLVDGSGPSPLDTPPSAPAGR